MKHNRRELALILPSGKKRRFVAPAGPKDYEILAWPTRGKFHARVLGEPRMMCTLDPEHPRDGWHGRLPRRGDAVTCEWFRARLITAGLIAREKGDLWPPENGQATPTPVNGARPKRGKTMTIRLPKTERIGEAECVMRSFEVPRSWRVLGPARGRRRFHVIAVGSHLTLCSNATEQTDVRRWKDGSVEGSEITCPWCRARMIHAGLLSPSVEDARFVEVDQSDETPGATLHAPGRSRRPIRTTPTCPPAAAEVVVGEAEVQEQYTLWADVHSRGEPRRVTRREHTLVRAYKAHVEQKGLRVRVNRISIPDAGTYETDAWVPKLRLLIEAKSSVRRESIRMAIGQIADYKRHVKPEACAVLLPQRPSPDLEQLLETEGVALIWQESVGFSDNRGGAYV